MAEFTYEVKKRLATLSETGTLSTELNVISFNGNAPKYDLRRWKTKEGDRTMQKGITLTTEEIVALRDALNKLMVISKGGSL